MTRALRVSLAQPVCVAGDLAATVAEHARLVDRSASGSEPGPGGSHGPDGPDGPDSPGGPDSRLVVFPELSLTGYVLDADAVAPDAPVLAPLREACRRTGATALVGAPVREGARRFLAVLALDAAGARTAYRKVCLGEEEKAFFDAGTRPEVIEVDGWRVGLGTCRDTGVPAQVAATLALGVDLYAAGVAHHDHELAEQDARGRRIAREHGVAVAMASFAGATGGGFLRTAGTSTMWDASGAVLARADDRPGSCVSAWLTPAAGTP